MIRTYKSSLCIVILNIYPFNRQIIQSEFSPTSSCGSRQASENHSDLTTVLKYLLIDVTFYL